MQLQNRLLQPLAIILLIFLQVVIFNNINFLGIANPFIYLIFILLLPLDTNRYLVLIYAFILGIGVDLFEMTGGINAFSTVLIAFIRPLIIRGINFGNTEEAEKIKLFRFNIVQWFFYLIIPIFIHYFVIIFIEQFNIDQLQRILIQTAIGTSITFLLIGIYIILFPPKRKHEF